MSAVNNVKLFEGEKNVDYLEFLIPPTYNDINILDCDIKLTYITPDNNEHYLLINDFVQEDTYKDCLRFVINIDENFTSIVGEITMYLTFLESDLKDIILKSSPTTIFISEHPYGKEGITEEQLNIIDEVLLRSKEALKIAQSVRNDADNGAFDGLSPIITVSDIDNGHKVDIEDKDGQKSFNVLNGENGKDGKDYVLTDSDKEEIATSINAADKNIYGNAAINLGRKQDSEIGRNSIAYGDNVVASGEGSIATGLKTQAIGKYAYASGHKTIAGYNYQFVLGIANENKEDNLFEIGNGSVTQNPDDKDNLIITRSNAFEVGKDGTVTAAKDFKVGAISLIEKIKQIDEELNGVRYLIIGNVEEV